MTKLISTLGAAGLMLVTIGAVHLDATVQQQRKLEGECELENKPLPVFIMLGQSNMVGKGSIEHLSHLLNDRTTRQKYSHLWDRDAGDWAESENVYVMYERYGEDLFGKLKAGDFGDEGDIHKFGPELEFGFVLEKAQCGCDSPILIVKCAVGGQSLVKDWRPPSSGGETGPTYNQCLFEINDVIDQLEDGLLVPDYANHLGFEYKGLVWFQGYNDIFEPDWVNEYSQNLINLIEDLRNEFEVPDLPVVVGETGMHGFESDADDFEGALAIRQAQQEAVDYFGDEVVYVPTAQFVNTHDDTYDGEYHYYGRADIVYNIGEAFGKAMVELLGGSMTCGAEEAY